MGVVVVVATGDALFVHPLPVCDGGVGRESSVGGVTIIGSFVDVNCGELFSAYCSRIILA